MLPFWIAGRMGGDGVLVTERGSGMRSPEWWGLLGLFAIALPSSVLFCSPPPHPYSVGQRDLELVILCLRLPSSGISSVS